MPSAAILKQLRQTKSPLEGFDDMAHEQKMTRTLRSKGHATRLNCYTNYFKASSWLLVMHHLPVVVLVRSHTMVIPNSCPGKLANNGLKAGNPVSIWGTLSSLERLCPAYLKILLGSRWQGTGLGMQLRNDACVTEYKTPIGINVSIMEECLQYI